MAPANFVPTSSVRSRPLTDVRDGYGQTETGQVTANPYGVPARPGRWDVRCPGSRRSSTPVSWWWARCGPRSARSRRRPDAPGGPRCATSRPAAVGPGSTGRRSARSRLRNACTWVANGLERSTRCSRRPRSVHTADALVSADTAFVRFVGCGTSFRMQPPLMGSSRTRAASGDGGRGTSRSR